MNKTISFARGIPAVDMLPTDAIAQAAATALRNDPAGTLLYGPGAGYSRLRSLLAERHGVTTEQVIVTNGSLQALWLLALCDEPSLRARRWIVENPTYDRPLVALNRLGRDVPAAIALDSAGLNVADLAADLGNDNTPALLYTIPDFHNPAGTTLTDERRDKLAALSAKHDLLILEDAPYSSLWFETPPPNSIFSRTSKEHVIHAASFSKTVAPGIRVGYVVVPEYLAAPLTALAVDTYIAPSLAGQAIVAEMIENGSLASAVARARATLQERCARLCAALDQHLPDFSYQQPGGGYFLWGSFPSGVNTQELLRAAVANGVTFVAGAGFGSGNENSLRLAFSSPPLDDIAPGIQRLAAAYASLPLSAAR